MKITVLQTDTAWANPQENHRRIDSMLGQADAQPDLIVLPEMFSTGFAVEPEGIAETSSQPTLGWMQQTARRLDCAVAGSVATKEGGDYRNRLFFVRPDGSAVHYDKRHLFTYGGESKHYVAGTSRQTAEWRGWRILLQVCYDLRFPVFSRNRGDYDLIIYSANWPASRIAVWQTLLRARAIENQCYVAGINRVGSDPQCHYPGQSLIIDPRGNAIAEAADAPAALTATLSLESLNAFRQKFPVLEDADDFSL